MTDPELASKPKPIEIEVGDGVSLLQFGPQVPTELDLAIWNGEGVIGGIKLVDRGDSTASISYVLDTEFEDQGIITNSFSKMGELFESLGVDSIVTELDADYSPDGKSFGATDVAYREALETAGFRVAAYSHEHKKVLYEMISSPPYYKPVRVDPESE